MGLVDAVLVSGASAIVWTWTDHARESANSFHFLRGVGDYGSQKIYSSVCVWLGSFILLAVITKGPPALFPFATPLLL